jgi:hypothetical protein
MTCRDTEEDEPMTDSATDQAPLDVPVPPDRNPMRDPRNRLKLAVFCASPGASRWPRFAPGSTG